MQKIRLPNGEVVQFPDGMSDDEMASAISSSFPEFAGDGATPAAAAPATAPGVEQSTAGRAMGAITAPLLDAISGAPDALRNMPVVRPTPHPDGVMGAAMENERITGKPMASSTAPEGVGDFTWARAQAKERAEPLDPRMVAIKPADPLALAEQQAALRANAGSSQFKQIMDRARQDNTADAADAQRQAEKYSLANLAGNATDNARNLTAAALKIGPTAVKGGADIARLFTGDTVGRDTSELMQEGMKAIDQLVASKAFNEKSAEFQQLMADEGAGVGDLFSFLIDNPSIMADAGITTIGSMFLPAGAARLGIAGARMAGLGTAGVTRAATVASAGTVAAQNASDTFTGEEVASLDMQDRYKAATVSAAITILTGMAFKGGAEGEIARRMAGDLRAGRTTLDAAKGYIKAALNEGAQEAGEEAGNMLGTSVATLEAPGFNNAVKQLAFAGTLGAIFGAGTHGAVGGRPTDPAGSRSSGNDRLEPTLGDPAPASTPASPTLEDVTGAPTLDAAIEAAQAVAAAPAPAPTPAAASPSAPGRAALASAAEIDALEQNAGLLSAAAGAPAPAGNEEASAPPADLPPGGEAAPQADPAGKNDDPADWHDFPPESRTLGVPRAQMPQIKAEHRGAMTQFLGARGIAHEQVELDANDLKPTQREFSVSKVQKAIDYVGGNRSILVSSDGYVLDGHHQWLAAAEKGEPIKAIRLNAPIKQLVRAVREFPSAGVDTSSAAPAAPAPARPGQELNDANEQRIRRQEEAVRSATENEAKRKNSAGQRQRDRVTKENPLLGFLASHGLNMDERSDTGGQGGRAGQIMVPGYGQLYRRSGKRLDELAQLALEAGFLTQEDIDNPSDTGGTRKLADMIQRAAHGREAIAPAGLLDAVAPTNDQRLIAEAQRLGIETEGKTADEVYDSVTAAHALEEDRREATGATSVDEQAEIERLADAFTAREAQLAADMARDADIPLDGGTSSDNLTDEDIDAIFGIQPGSARAAGQQTEEGAAGDAREGAARAGAESEGEGAPLLTEYTAEEVLERERKAADRAKAMRAEVDRLEAQRRRETDARELRDRAAATVDDFQLGQDAETQLSGQRGMFDAPTPEPAAPERPSQARTLEEARTAVAGYMDWYLRENPNADMPMSGMTGGNTFTFDPTPFGKAGEVMVNNIKELILPYRAMWKAAQESAAGKPQTALQKEVARAKGKKGDQLDNATAPEHVVIGVDERELGQIAAEFNAAQAEMMQDGQPITNIFTSPAKGEVVRLEDKTKVYHKDHGWMTVAEAKARIKEWKDHAQAQGEAGNGRSENSQRVVLSLFDLTGKWSQPWEEAGYQVYRFDIQADPVVGDVNNFSTEFFGDWFGDFEGMDIYAVLAACPCTDFASSGSRHFAAKDADGRTVASVKLVHQTLRVIEYFKPAVWAVENPVGRIEKLGGLPPWRLSFNPNHLGDPYTKRTLIWGRFNADLPIAPVEPTEGSKMHKLYGGKSMATKNARSATPEGFSYGFFMANNAIDNPVLAIHGKFDRLDRKLIEQAVAAGVTEAQITEAVEDFYYMELDDDAANDAIRQLMVEARDANDPATPTTPAADDGGQVPLDFYSTVDVDYVAVAGAEPAQLKANDALAKTRTDIGQLEAMLKCMGE